MFIYFLCLFVFATIKCDQPFPYKIFICEPIVDMVGETLSKVSDYSKIPISWGPNASDKIICPRVHQAIFNEIMTVHAEKNNQLLVEIPDLICGSEKKPARFWIPKKSAIPFNELKRNGLNKFHIPQPTNIRKKKNDTHSIVTLCMPHYDLKTKQWYSVGTRFVCSKSKIAGYYRVHIFNRHEYQFTKTLIPDSICKREQKQSKNEQISDFVTLLQNWAHNPNGSIPFCWGGTTATKFYQHVGARLMSKRLKNEQTVQYWVLTDNSTYPHSGFDASGLILRAAQICGIPYTCKNTTAAAEFLQPFSQFDTLEKGDLIWVPGGLFVVSDVKRNRLIGALGYQHGYGHVIELTLPDFFEGINSYPELLYAYEHQSSLSLKQANGIVYKTIEQFKFLKLRTVWNNY